MRKDEFRFQKREFKEANTIINIKICFAFLKNLIISYFLIIFNGFNTFFNHNNESEYI